MLDQSVAVKVEGTKRYGAEVVLHGAHVGETWQKVQELSADRGLVYCHPFDDPNVIAGNGSVGLEILDDLPDVDVVVAGIGGGGLISGVATALKESWPGVRVFGVEPTAVNTEMRAKIKAMNYGLAYGLSAFGLGQQLDRGALGVQAHQDLPVVRHVRRDGEPDTGLLELHVGAGGHTDR